MRFKRIRAQLAAAEQGITFEQKVSIFALPVSAIVDLSSYFIFKFNPNAFYFALGISTVSALFADRLARASLDNKILKAIESVNARNESLRHIGDAVEAMAWFSGHSSGLTSVDNIAFRPRDGKHAFVIDHIGGYLDSIKSSLSGECRWRDLFLHGQRDAFRAFARTLSKDQRQHYRAAMVKSSVPLFQMMILRYKKDDPAVLFGWGYEGGKSAPVFVSRASDTVTYFENYFEQLYHNAEPLHEHGHPLRAQDLADDDTGALSGVDAESLSLTYIGNSGDGFRWLARNNRGLQAVYNTVYRPTRSTYRHLQDDYRKYFAAIREAIGGKCVWHDLLMPDVEIPTIPLRSFYDSLGRAQRSGYQAKELVGVDVPFLQITVLKYLNGECKVGIGYGFPKGDDSMVFVSSHERTVLFFEKYFLALYGSPKARTLFEESGQLETFTSGLWNQIANIVAGLRQRFRR
jgi:hypothetical protein